MDLNSYSTIIIIVILVTTLGVPMIVIAIWLSYPKSEVIFMLVTMKGIISQNNVDKKATLFVCNREMSDVSGIRFMVIAIVIIMTCAQIFFALASVEISYECINDPDLDCFKMKDAMKTALESKSNPSPVNCSLMTKDDSVQCYRIVAFDPQKVFIAASAAYLLFRMINVALFIIAHIMLWVARKWKRKTVRYTKLVFALIVAIVVYTPFILALSANGVESAIRQIKLSYAVFLQATLLLCIIFLSILLPWQKFVESEEYLRDVSLPISDVYANEMN